jgi:hypothetical protein
MERAGLEVHGCLKEINLVSHDIFLRRFRERYAGDQRTAALSADVEYLTMNILTPNLLRQRYMTQRGFVCFVELAIPR